MPAGRSKKIKSVKALQKAIEKYFEKCVTEGRRPLIIDLALFLNLHRESLDNYEKLPEFFDTIKKAKDRCLSALVNDGLSGKCNPTMAIFISKAGHGLRETSELDVNMAARVIYQTVDVEKPDDTGVSARSDDDA